MYTGLHVKYPLFLSDFNNIWILSSFSKNAQISNFVKICPVEAELFHAGQTDGAGLRTDRHDEANSSFRNFANAHKSVSRYLVFWPKVELITSRTQVKSVTTCAYLLAANVSSTVSTACI